MRQAMKQIDNITFFFEQEVSYPLEDVKYLLGSLYEEFLLNKFIYLKQSGIRFNYVGIAANHKQVLCILPKHLHASLQVSDDYVNQARLLIQVLKIYERRIHTDIDSVDFFRHSHASNTNEIAIADYLLNDYIQYGVWIMDQRTITTIGNGEVFWDHTIEQTQPLLGKAPIYYETYHLHTEIVTDSLVSQIHQWALSYSLKRYGILLNLDIGLPREYDMEIECVGSKEFLLAILERQLRITYADRDIRLLRALMELIQITHDYTDSEFSLYGHNSFEHIWEDVISFCFGNEYGRYAHHLSKPTWNNGKVSVEKQTLRPDVLRWLPHTEKPTFLIIDAKYYLIRFDDEQQSLENNPGVDDVVKQYFYEFILDREGTDAPWKNTDADYLNVLIFPMLSDSVGSFQYLGTVHLSNRASNKPIINIAGNPTLLFERYCTHRTFEEQQLATFVESISAFL